MHLYTPFKVSLLAAAIALTGCGGDSSSSSSKDEVVDEVVDEGNGTGGGDTGTPVSGFTISANGGVSTLGNGGNGGDLYVEKYNSASALTLKKGGSVDSSYTLPAHELDLGTNPVTVTENVTVYRVHDEDEASRTLPPAGTLYMLDEDMEDYGPDDNELEVYRLYKSDGLTALGAKSTQVTGLVIETGAALILPKVHGNTVSLYLRNDVQNNGLITTAKQPDTDSRIGLELYTAAYYGSGSIDVAGDAQTYHGQRGGQVSVYAHTIVNSGAITTSGANDGAEGNSGGDAGDISFAANIFLENAGALTAAGGTSPSYSGGEGGDINLSALELYNSGAISANSGAGRNGYSYSSSQVDVALVALRTLINTGDISAKGAKAHGDGNYNASKGGDIYLNLLPSFEDVSLDKKLVTTGNLTVDGGSTEQEATGRAGSGGNIYIQAGDEYLAEGDSPDEDTASALSTQFVVAGNISANGGNTDQADDGSNAHAGTGGVIRIEGYDQSTSNVESGLFGYDSISLQGGVGMTGGYGGDVEILSGDMRDERGGSYVPSLSGPLSNEIDLNVDGGSSLAQAVEVGEDEERGYGRSAGDVELLVENGFAYLQPGVLTLNNTGSVTANAGRSYTELSGNNNHGGSLLVRAPDAVTHTANFSAVGGHDERVASGSDLNGHVGGEGGDLLVISQYAAAAVEGTVDVSGGNGQRRGGDAGIVNMFAKTALTAKGTYTLNGGNAEASAEDALSTEGGDAGFVTLMSAAYNSSLEATVTAEAGAGDLVGESKLIMVDADCESDFCNVEDIIALDIPR